MCCFLFFFSLPVMAGLFAGDAFAEEQQAHIDEIVVTATRSEKGLDAVPGEAAVVTRKDLQRRTIKTLDDALSGIPGLYTRKQSGSMVNLSLHGVPDLKRSLFMQDGIPLNNSYTGNVRYQGFASDVVERIEIVQGPFSSLYGGSAMGGVVNIITRMPEKREASFSAGYGRSWSRGTAPDDYRHVSLLYGDRLFERLSLLVGYDYKATNGFPQEFNIQSLQPPGNIGGWTVTSDTSGSGKYLIGDKGDSYWRDDNITVKAAYDFSPKTRLTASFINARYDYGTNEPQTLLFDQSGLPRFAYDVVTYSKRTVKGKTTLVPNTKSVFESTFLNNYGGSAERNYHLALDTEIDTVKMKASVGILDLTPSWYVTPGSTQATTRSGGPGKLSTTPTQNYSADMQFAIPLFAGQVLTVGGSFRHGVADMEEYNLSSWLNEDSRTALTYRAGGRDTTWALFFQDEIALAETLTAYIGGRMDWWRTFDGYADQIGTAGYPKNYDERSASSFSPKAALVFTPFAGTALRASAGKAFRPPTVYELYRTWTSSSGVTYNGNPDLKPEKLTAWDVGAEQSLWSGAKVKLSYFENYLKNLVYRKTVSSTQRDYINAGKAESRGVIAGIEQKVSSWLRLHADVTFVDSRIRENSASPASQGKRMTDVPGRTINIGADFEYQGVKASFLGTYVSKRYGDDTNADIVNGVYTSYDPYFTLNGKISYAIMKHAELSFAVDNILNRDYFSYYKAPGRSWFAELKIAL